MSKCTLWQGLALATMRQQGVVPPQEHKGVTMSRWIVPPQGLGVATTR